MEARFKSGMRQMLERTVTLTSERALTWTEIEERGGSEAWEGKGHWCGGRQSGTVQVQPPGAEAACVLGRFAGAEKVRFRACVYVPLPFGFSLSDCQFEEDQKKHFYAL